MSHMNDLQGDLSNAESEIEELKKRGDSYRDEAEKYLAAFGQCGKDLTAAVDRCLLAESEQRRWHKAFADETLKHDATTRERDALKGRVEELERLLGRASDWSEGFPHALRDEVEAALRAPEKEGERIHPCAECGVMRSKAEGGTTFTVCDECWDVLHDRAPDKEGV